MTAVLNPGTPHVQICVKWDIARSLMLIPGHDLFEKVGTDLSTLREIVFGNLNNAVENGYYEPLDSFTPDQLCVELTAFAEDCQDVAEHLLLPHVNAWIATQKGAA